MMTVVSLIRKYITRDSTATYTVIVPCSDSDYRQFRFLFSTFQGRPTSRDGLYVLPVCFFDTSSSSLSSSSSSTDVCRIALILNTIVRITVLEGMKLLGKESVIQSQTVSYQRRNKYVLSLFLNTADSDEADITSPFAWQTVPHNRFITGFLCRLF